MRPPEFSDQDIIQAGQEILASGRPVNGFALRAKTGGGKAERLLKVWEEHVSGQTAAPLRPAATELPLEMADELAAVTKALTERMAALAMSLNDKAVQAAERRVHQIQRSADEQGGKDKAALADASDVVEELQTKLSQAETNGEAVQNQLADALALIEARTGELGQANERLAAQERQSQQASVEHANEVARLKKLLEDERTNHKDAVELQRGELREQDEKATLTREALNKEVATAKAEAAAAKHALSQHEASIQERIKTLETERLDASEAAGTAREKAARLEGQVETLQAQVTELMRVIAIRMAAQDVKDGSAADTSHKVHQDHKGQAETAP